MFTIRTLLTLSVLSLISLGCSNGPEPKKIPKMTPDQKAANDKAHEETKAGMSGVNTSPADAPK